MNGVVLAVDERSPAEQAEQGLRVTIQPEGSAVVQIDLAPGWYLRRQGLRLSQHDRLTVLARSGSEGPVLRAQSVSNGIVEVPLRHADGRPYWTGAVSTSQ